ncbi:MAG: hypothetical protein K0Q95_2916 [Bacteroidota bacterium]|jgi:N-acetyl sugar amidotransferase|nr:hypothetical protein [Bacteroidota bacterium]
MKKVLILAYDFPPYVSVGGLRPYAWYRYFKEFNIYPIVVTRQWGNNYESHLDYVAPSESSQTIIENTEYGTIIKTPYRSNYGNRLMLKHGESKFKLARKFVTAYFEFIQWPFAVGPKSELYHAAKDYLKNNQVDAIIATGEPFVLFKYASMLSEEFNIPWIADYRDPWSQNVKNTKLLYKIWNSHFEKKIVNKASSIITVSEFVKSKIESLIPDKKYCILSNGYDPEVIDRIKDVKQQSTSFNIAFVGTIYDWHPIHSFLTVIKNFIRKNPDAKIAFNLYGINLVRKIQEMVRNEFQEISSSIHFFPKMQNDILLKKLAEDNVMLLFNDYSIIGTKIYDYMAVKRSIILCYSNDPESLALKKRHYNIKEEDNLSSHLQADLINETKSGHIISDSKDLGHVIDKLYQEFIQTGAVQCNTDQISKYSRRQQTQILAEHLKLIGVGTTAAERQYQLCTRCVMDTSDPSIRFNEAGECNNCNEFISKRAKHKYHGSDSDKEFASIINEMKEAGKGKEYDCVIGLSGGIDSSYVAYISKEHGLRVLAVHMDNGWNSDEAVTNIKNIANKLSIDYESDVLDWEEFRDVQLAFLKASVPEAETPTDMAILSSLHRISDKYNIKYIISGGNFATEGILPKYWHYNAKDIKYFNYIQKKFGNKKLRHFPVFGYRQEMYYKLIKGKKIIYLLNYIPYSKSESMDFLQKKLDWRYYGGKHYESVYTGFIQSYYLYKKFGIDYRRATLSTQICTGDVSRECALKELEKLPYSDAKAQTEKEYIAKKLGISLEEFDRIIQLPPRWYSDYPNDEKWLGFIYDTYRKLFKKDKLANF